MSIKKICILFSHILCCVSICFFSSCNLQNSNDEHQLFISVFNDIQMKHPNLELVDLRMYGYGEYDILYTPSNENDNQYECISELLYEFDQTINNSEEYIDLLNGCYIKIESDSNTWIAIQYRYDIDVQIHTNFSEDNIPIIKDYFPYEKIIAFHLIDGKPVQLEY